MIQVCGKQIGEVKRLFAQRLCIYAGEMCVRARACVDVGGRRAGLTAVGESDVSQSGPKSLSSQANDSGGSPVELR